MSTRSGMLAETKVVTRLEDLLASEGPLPLEDIERKLPPRGTEELAKTLWGEGRGEGAPGMHAIANVVTNRTKDPEFSRDPVAVATNPSHFSVWQPTDPNYPKMQDLDETDENYRVATDLARRALDRSLPDVTGGATHYYSGSKEPFWAPKMQPTKELGKHKFFKKPRRIAQRKKKAEPTGGPQILGDLD